MIFQSSPAANIRSPTSCPESSNTIGTFKKKGKQIFNLQIKWKLIHLTPVFSKINSHWLTHWLTDSMICPHNALVSHLKLVPGFCTCLSGQPKEKKKCAMGYFTPILCRCRNDSIGEGNVLFARRQGLELEPPG